MKLTQREQRALVKAARVVADSYKSDKWFYHFSCAVVAEVSGGDDLSNRYAEATGANAMRFGTHHQYREAIEAVSFETQLARSLCILLYKESQS